MDIDTELEEYQIANIEKKGISHEVGTITRGTLKWELGKSWTIKAGIGNKWKASYL